MPPPDPTPFKPRARPAHTKRHRTARSPSPSSGSNSDSDHSCSHRRQKVEVITTYGEESSDEQAGKHSRSKHHHRHSRSSRRSRSREDGGRRSRSPDQRNEQQEEEEKEPVKWGLTINMKGAGKSSKDKATSSQRDDDTTRTENTTRKRPLTVDDEALEALIGNPSSPSKRPKPSSSNDDPDAAPQLSDYKAIPIDDFGATLLRGYGWDGQLKGKVKEVNRRANLTGLGAKDVKGAEDLGSWNQKAGGPPGGGVRDSRPVRLEDYRREEGKKRERRDARERDSYKRERERERERDRDRR